MLGGDTLELLPRVAAVRRAYDSSIVADGHGMVAVAAARVRHLDDHHLAQVLLHAREARAPRLTPPFDVKRTRPLSPTA